LVSIEITEAQILWKIRNMKMEHETGNKKYKLMAQEVAGFEYVGVPS
jgi:hypothetical protein